jgi:site-specific DNA recombinase
MTNAAIYTRISLDATGQRVGVTRQFEDCQALADPLGFEVVAHFDDNDMSAFSGKRRDGFEDMLVRLKNGEFDAVLCWHPDRLYRSLKDLERLIDIADVTGAQLRTVNGGDLDLSTATGKMLARILGSVSRQESEHKGERQRRANTQRRAAKRWVAGGQPPFGYVKVGEPRAYRLEPREPAATMVKQAAVDVLSGVSLRSIATDWNRRGVLTARGKQWTNLALRRVLMNPIYAGQIAHNGKIVGDGDWEPLLTGEQHRGLVAYLSDPSRRSSNAFERKHVGSGVYRCGKCGEKLYAAFPHGRNKMLYICRTTHLGRMGQPIDEMVESVVLGVLSDTDIRKFLTEGKDIDIKALDARRDILHGRRSGLATLLAKGLMDEASVTREAQELTDQIAGIDKMIGDATCVSPALDLVNKADGDPDKLIELWKASSADIKGKIIDEMMTVTVNPSPSRGPRGFDPKLIDIVPKFDASTAPSGT